MTYTPTTHPLRDIPVEKWMYRNATAALQTLQTISATINLNEKGTKTK